MAYLAMFEFLRQYEGRGASEDIQILLSNLSLLEDGRPADPALAEDWLKAIRAVQASEQEPGGYKPVKFRLG